MREKDWDGRKVWSPEDFGKYEMQDCWVCKGTGKDNYYADEHGSEGAHDCGMCNGSGKNKEWVSDAPSLNVSNGNAFQIFDMLGVQGDHSGTWSKEEMSVIMQRLLKLKNTDTSSYTRKPSTQQNVRVSKDASGMSQIGRGPTMIDGGVHQTQVNRYVDTLMNMVQFAQKNNANIGWG